MINIKTNKEITSMRKGGQILAEVLFASLKEVKPGITEAEIDVLADKLIVQKGGYPGFKLVPGWKHATCMSTNDVVVHGIPTDYKFQEDDIVGVDCGVLLEKLHTDMSESIRILNGKPKFYSGKPEDDGDATDLFLNTGKRALNEAIKSALPGNHIGDISKIIQDIVEKQAGYSITRSLIGHGVGYELHEEPEVPGYLTRKIARTPLLKIGMTIAIEVIYTMGSNDLVLDRDGWTIRTADGNLAGLFERTIAITKNGPEVLTK